MARIEATVENTIMGKFRLVRKFEDNYLDVGRTVRHTKTGIVGDIVETGYVNVSGNSEVRGHFVEAPKGNYEEKEKRAWKLNRVNFQEALNAKMEKNEQVNISKLDEDKEYFFFLKSDLVLNETDVG